MPRIGLCQVDGKKPNLALMKLAAHHKGQGDKVEWFLPLRRYDTVYASKVFDFTPDNSFLPLGTIRGGSGYDLIARLPDQVELICPDYSLYPGMDYALGFTTRGCPRVCPFCVVPRKEGRLRIVGDLHDFWRYQQKVCLLDNNLTAASIDHFKTVINQLLAYGLEVDFSQGLDIRLLTDLHAAWLKPPLRLWKQIHFAWDSMRDEGAVRRGIDLLRRHMSLSRAMFYVLIGFDSTPEEDLYRVNELQAMGVDSFVMPFNKSDLYQRSFARWVNHKAIYKSVPWSEYHGGILVQTTQ